MRQAASVRRRLQTEDLTPAPSGALMRYLRPERLAHDLPTLRLLTRPLARIRALAERLAPAVGEAVAPRFAVEVVDLFGQIGSGSLPNERLPSAGLALAPQATRSIGTALDELAAALRGLPRPVIGRVAADRLRLDLRCREVPDELVIQLPALRAALIGAP